MNREDFRFGKLTGRVDFAKCSSYPCQRGQYDCLCQNMGNLSNKQW